jgi:hypothetical protein
MTRSKGGSERKESIENKGENMYCFGSILA